MTDAKNPQLGTVAGAGDLQAQINRASDAATDAFEQARRADAKADQAHEMAVEAKRQATKATERTSSLKERIRIIGTELVSLGEDRDARIETVETTSRQNAENIVRIEARAEGRQDAEATGQHMLVHVTAAEERAARERDAERLANEREGNRELSKATLGLIGTALTIISGFVTWLMTKALGGE